jgi:hypothetical protein
MEGFDQLTPEEAVLVQCLKGCRIPGKDEGVDNDMSVKEIGEPAPVHKNLHEAAEEKGDEDLNPRSITEVTTFPADDDRSLKTIVREINQAIGDDITRIQTDSSAVWETMDDVPAGMLTVPTLKALLEKVETLLLHMAGFRENIQHCIQVQQQLDAETAVREMIDKGFECRQIQIDDICFEIDDDKTIRRVNAKGSKA